MFNNGKQVKITDFGFSRSITSSSVKTALGTKGYLGVEVLFGRPVDYLSDIFALGATLHYMLTLETPDIVDNIKKSFFKIPD